MEFIALLRSDVWILCAACGAIGLCVGSFLNVVIHRLPKMMEAQWRSECAELNGAPLPASEPYNLFKPDSRCPSCSTPIRSWQNIPLVSWMALRGRCAACGVPISMRYPLVELLAGVLSGVMAWRFGYGMALVFALGFAWALVALTFIDLDTQLLPDDITFPLLWAGVLANAFGLFVDLRSSVLGAMGGYLLLWSVYWGFRLLAKKEGMGYGDFKLLGALGAWAGWQVLPFVVVIAATFGAVIGSLALLLAKKGIDTRIPFGPYLALGGLAALLWGREAVIAWVGAFPVL